MSKVLLYILGFFVMVYGNLSPVQAQAVIDTTVTVTIDSSGTGIEELMPDEAEADTAVTDWLSPADRSAISRRSADTAKVSSLRKDEDFWYVNTVLKRKVTEPTSDARPSRSIKGNWLRNLLWMLVVGGFLVLIVSLLHSQGFHLFRKPRSLATGAEEEALPGETLFNLDYAARIQKAIAAGNYRQAVRLHYLQTLRWLTEQGLITYKDNFTNADYRLQLASTQYHSAFRRLTYHFDYAWYGGFPLTELQYKSIEADFIRFKGGGAGL